MSDPFEIGRRRVGAGAPVFIIAEMSANHRGDFDEARRLLREAARAGADAIKLQTYTPSTMTLDSDDAPFRIGAGTVWEGRTLWDLYGEAATPWEWHADLQRLASELDLEFFSSPFDATAVDFLESLDVPAYKIASFELGDQALLRRVAETGKPVLASTGMATFAEIEEAVAIVRSAGNGDLALLKCTSAYPAPADEVNLRTIPYLADRFGVPVGLSDHTLGIAVPVAAVALGARVIEKHLTLSRGAGGPDAAFSLEPSEFAAMVDAVRTAEAALGAVRQGATDHEVASQVFRRSLFVVEPVRAGEILTRDNVRSIRPGHGLPPRHLEEVLGRRARVDIDRGTPLAWELLDDRPDTGA
jgi:N-acetylneuraminate synthase